MSSLPKSIGRLESLEILQLDRNELISLPESIGNLSSLEKLYLNGNKLRYLPKTIGMLKSVWIFHLDGNELISLPESIGNLTLLETLNLHGNKLTHLPKSIGQLKKLELFQLDGNKLLSLPNSIGKLTSLEKLHLYRNKLSSLPNSIGQLKALEILQLDGNELTSLPESIEELTLLKKIYLTKNPLNQLPESLKTLEKRGCVIFLPESLKDIKKKQLIESKLINYNDVQLYKSEYNVVFDLEKLINETIPITKDPERELFGIYVEEGHVINLILNYKKLTKLPETIKELTELKKLDLQRNELNSLPESIGELTALKKLNLTHNKFRKLPGSLWTLNNLTELKLNNNPWEDDSRNIVNNSIPIILDYCRKIANIQIFISHTVNEKEKYHVEDIAQGLENQPEIYKVLFCERDLIGDIDEFMNKNIPNCQLLLFIASQQSVFESKDCKHELEVAKKNNLKIIPIKCDDVSWEDLETLNLSRQLGLELTIDKFDEFCERLYAYIKEYKRNIKLFEKKQAQVDKEILQIKNYFLKIIETIEFNLYIKNNIEEIREQQYGMGEQLIELIKFLIKLLNSFKDSEYNFNRDK